MWLLITILARLNGVSIGVSAAQSEFRPALAERVVAIGFLATVSAAMMGWLYLLAVAMWNGASWLARKALRAAFLILTCRNRSSRP